MPVPNSALAEQKPQGGIVASAPRNIPVFIGVSSRGTLSPNAGATQSWGRNGQKAIAAYHGAGPLSRRGGYIASQMGGESRSIRVPATARAASKSALTITSLTMVGFGALTGTPADGGSYVITVTTSGTTGTSYSYTLTRGGVTGAPVDVTTGLTIVVDGVTLTLTTGKTITAGDTFAWTARAASAAILPRVLTKVGTSTATYAVTGTPADRYRFRLEWLTGGTLATAGATGRYCLDWDAVQQTGTFVTFALGTDLTILPLDGVEPSGLTITLATSGSGTIDAGDVLEFGTTAPEAQASDIVAAMAVVRASGLTWSWFVVLNPGSSSDVASYDSLLSGASWAGGGRRTWALAETRDRETYETIAQHAASERGDFSSYTSTRVFACGGSWPPAADPITGRRSLMSSVVDYAARFAVISISTDAGWLNGLGALPAARILYAPGTGGQQIAYDADADGQLFDAQGPYKGFLVLRTFEDDAFPGTYPAGSICMPSAGDLGLVQLRRVLDAFEDALQSQARLELLSDFRRWTTAQVAKTAGKYKAGDIREEDALAMDRRLYAAAFSAVVATGNATAVTASVNRTPTPLGPPGIFGITYVGQCSAFGTIYQISGTAFLLLNG